MHCDLSTKKRSSSLSRIACNASNVRQGKLHQHSANKNCTYIKMADVEKYLRMLKLKLSFILALSFRRENVCSLIFWVYQLCDQEITLIVYIAKSWS